MFWNKLPSQSNTTNTQLQFQPTCNTNIHKYTFTHTYIYVIWNKETYRVQVQINNHTIYKLKSTLCIYIQICNSIQQTHEHNFKLHTHIHK